MTKILRKAELIDLKGQWIGNETILVQTGDIVDRGKDTIACYRFMQGLRGDAEKKGGTVVSLLGNHEIVRVEPFWSLREVEIGLMKARADRERRFSFVDTDERFRRLALCQPTRYRVTYLFFSLSLPSSSRKLTCPLSLSQFIRR